MDRQRDVLAVHLRDHAVHLVLCRLVVRIHKAVGVSVQSVVVEDRAELAPSGRGDEGVRLQGRLALLVVRGQVGLEIVEILESIVMSDFRLVTLA